ncbi:MAG: AraC family transcriptional regulator [Acidobacteria bacterium]|nr:AraC family transcriptional regulator [Acidobacteriota bacterium]
MIDASLTIWNVAALAAMLQGVLLFLFLLMHRTSHRRANLFLAALVLCYALDIGLETLYASPRVTDYHWLIGFNDALFFLYGPLLYWYALLLTQPDASANQRWLVHFLPCLLVLIVYTPALFTQSVAVKLSSEGLQALPAGATTFLTAERRGQIELASALHELAYLIATLFLLRQHRRRIEETFSSLDRINLNWLKGLTLATSVIVVVDIFLYFFVSQQWVAYDKAVTFILLLCASLIYAIGYMGLRQPAIFTPVSEGNAPTVTLSESEPPREKYAKSALTEPQADEGLARLLGLMEGEKLYLNGELKLSDVAEALGISANSLSQIINEKLGKNFYDFVNGYRVEAASRLLADPKKDHLTLLAIAFEAGFNSKSTFNSVFKKHKQMTPSEFKKQLAKVSEAG